MTGATASAQGRAARARPREVNDAKSSHRRGSGSERARHRRACRCDPVRPTTDAQADVVCRRLRAGCLQGSRSGGDPCGRWHAGPRERADRSCDRRLAESTVHRRHNPRRGSRRRSQEPDGAGVDRDHPESRRRHARRAARAQRKAGSLRPLPAGRRARRSRRTSGTCG
jgi:hypothetical protein